MLMGSNSNNKLFDRYDDDETLNFDYNLIVSSFMVEEIHTTIKAMPVCKVCGKELLDMPITFFAMEHVKAYLHRNIYHTKKECDNAR